MWLSPNHLKDLAIEKGLEIVKRFKEFGGVSLEELIEIMCKEDKQLRVYFGYGEKSLKMSKNSKVRGIYELLKRNPHIIIKDEKPVVLKWLYDTYDICDKDKISKNIQNEEKNSVEKSSKSDLEAGSHISHISYTEVKVEEEREEREEQTNGFQLSVKGPIHLREKVEGE